MELNFYINGKPLNCPVTGVRGTVFPVIYGNYSCVDVEIFCTGKAPKSV